MGYSPKKLEYKIHSSQFSNAHSFQEQGSNLKFGSNVITLLIPVFVTPTQLDGVGAAYLGVGTSNPSNMWRTACTCQWDILQKSQSPKFTLAHFQTPTVSKNRVRTSNLVPTLSHFLYPCLSLPPNVMALAPPIWGWGPQIPATCGGQPVQVNGTFSEKVRV